MCVCVCVCMSECCLLFLLQVLSRFSFSRGPTTKMRIKWAFVGFPFFNLELYVYLYCLVRVCILDWKIKQIVLYCIVQILYVRATSADVAIPLYVCIYVYIYLKLRSTISRIFTIIILTLVTGTTHTVVQLSISDCFSAEIPWRQPADIDNNINLTHVQRKVNFYLWLVVHNVRNGIYFPLKSLSWTYTTVQKN